jgi:arylsulfatase A-like enzyme
MLRYLLVILIVLILNSCRQEEKPGKLNFLILTCEDISPFLSMYGDSTARTPNLDRLASEGLVYTRAFAPVGACAPSRSAIITGMYPTSIGTHHMRTSNDYNGWGYRNYDRKFNVKDIEGNPLKPYSVVLPPQVRCFTEYLRAEGYYCSNNFKTDYQFAAPVTAWDANGRDAHWKNRKPGQPFLAVFNDMVTHESRLWLNDSLPLTVNPEDVRIPSYLPDDELVRKDFARLYSNIELMDKQVGNRINELEEAGLLDETVIIWFSDHGGPFPKAKREHSDDGLRVPFIISLPDEHGGILVNDLVSFVDVAPTVLSLAGIPIPKHLQGYPFLGDQRGKPRKYIFGSGDRFDNKTDRCRIARDKRYLYVKNYFPELPAYKDLKYRKNIPSMRVLLEYKEKSKLNEDQLYWFRKSKTPEELYDCAVDPHCLRNLIDNPECTAKASELRNSLEKWQADVGDLGSIPERKMLDSMWPGGTQPKTRKPEIHIENGELLLNCPTHGASIAYLLSERRLSPDLNSGWQLYHSPIRQQQGKYLYVMATRIGYKDSEVHEYLME